MSADITEDRIAERLGFLADELRSWLKYNEKGHGKTDEELSGDIHVMLSNGYTDAPPCWPSRSVLKHWIGTLDSARSRLAALQSVPQGVEVPEMPVEDLLECLVYKLDSPTGLLKDCPMDEEYSAQRITEWFRARLAPTPPQAAPGAVDVVLDPPKSDRDCGDCTRLAICNGELACLCGPTGKMFDRKEPPHPLQPEERRVGPDEVVVPKREWQAAQAFAAKWFTGCDESEARKESDAWCLERPSALRTSAQDHNGEGAK